MEVNRTDVITANADAFPIGAETFKGSELLGLIQQRAGNVPGELFEQGVPCQMLSVAAGGGFREGRLRITLDFIPGLSPIPQPQPQTGAQPATQAG